MGDCRRLVRSDARVGALLAMLAVPMVLTGCQSLSGNGAASPLAGQLTGKLMGGEQPVVGATIQLYAAGSGGDGNGASTLLNPAVTTDQSGSFNITNDYKCPTQTTEVYLVATGGNSGQASSNPNIALMAALGQCGVVSAPSFPSIYVDEVTTVASVAALYPFMSASGSYASVASGSSDAAALTNAFTTVNEYVNLSTGTAPGSSLPSGYYASSNEVDSLANILAYCIDSTGGVSGSSTPCGSLFKLTTPVSGTPPSDTVGALIDILNNPGQNVGLLFNLIASQSPYQPADSAAPTSWALPILQVPAAPTFSLAQGTYTSAQTLTITDSVSGVAIYYTTNGTTPTTASTLYTGPVPIASTETVTAIAVNDGRVSGPTTSATYTLPPDFTLSASPQTVGLVVPGTVPVDLEVTPINGFSGTVTVTIATSLTSGVTANASSYTVTPGIVTQIELTATSSVYTTQVVTITGVSGSLTHSTTFELSGGAKPDYQLTSSSAAVSLVAGSSQTLNLTATALNGFTGTVTGQVTGVPAGVTVSPSSYTLTLGQSQLITVTAGSGAATGNNVLTFTSTSGALTHSTPVVVNYGSQTQDFVLGTPVSLSVAPNGSTTMTLMASAIGGFSGNVTATISNLPAGVSATQSTVTLSVVPAVIVSNLETPTNIATVTLMGSSTLASGTSSFTVTATSVVGSTTLTHQNSVVITRTPNGQVAANVCTSGNAASACQNVTLAGNAATAFPSYFVGFSMPSATLEEFAGTGTTTWPSFVNLLSNLDPYVGPPSIRSQLPGNSTDLNLLAALTTGAKYTSNSVTSYPQYFLTATQQYTLSSDLSYVQGAISDAGSANVLGFELDNEPDEFVPEGYRPTGWTYSDYLTETAGYQTTFAPVIKAPQLIATAAAFDYWDVGLPAVMSQMSGQLSTFTAHRYALSACSSTAPTVAQLLADSAAHDYYTRFAGLVQTLGSVPVRVGEMNSVSCTGTAGVSNTLASSLWLVDTAFEAKLAGAAGFNLHSNGSLSNNGPYGNGAAAYDIGFNSSSGQLAVYAPFYGALFFAQAIQNGAKPLPVVIGQTSGNVKVWATIDASNAVRVVVLEKDTDSTSNTKTVTINLGTSYTKTGTVTTMWAGSTGSVSSTSGISIAGQTFDGTTNGVLTPSTPSTTTVNGSGGTYTITVNDGTATILTVPK
jgi:hypothetical protein